MNMGQIYATSDMATVDSFYKNGAKVIFIGDPMEIPKGYNFINGIIFTPDYQTMLSIVENDQQKFTERYWEMLKTPNSEEMFAVILAALFNGVNIVLYFPEDTLQLKYPLLLVQYLSTVFGITVGNAGANVPFVYNASYTSSNMKLLYLHNIINWEEFLLKTNVLDIYSLTKLRAEVIPVYKIDSNISNEDFLEKIDVIKFYLEGRIAARKSNNKRLFSREATKKC